MNTSLPINLRIAPVVPYFGALEKGQKYLFVPSADEPFEIVTLQSSNTDMVSYATSEGMACFLDENKFRRCAVPLELFSGQTPLYFQSWLAGVNRLIERGFNLQGYGIGTGPLATFANLYHEQDDELIMLNGYCLVFVCIGHDTWRTYTLNEYL